MVNVDRFIDGFRRFQRQLYGKNEHLAAKLKQGQSPSVMVISCSDSRVDPALLTDCSPGDIFTLRNVANLVPPYESDAAFHGVSAALEYAVCSLKVQDIIVIGHSSCGGIDALLKVADGEIVGEFVGRWVSIATAARNRALTRMAAGNGEELSCLCAQEAILTSLTNLKTFPWLEKRHATGALRLHGWYYNIKTGRLLGYQTKTERFEALVDGYEPFCPLPLNPKN